MKYINIPGRVTVKSFAALFFLFSIFSFLGWTFFRQDDLSLQGAVASVLNDESLSAEMSDAVQEGSINISSLENLGLITVDALLVTGNSVLGNDAKDSVTFNARALSIPNGLNIGTGAFFIDTFKGFVGIGDTTPKEMLTVGEGDRFRVSSQGKVTAARGIVSSGTIRFSGLSDGIVMSDSDGTLDTVSRISAEKGGTGIDASQASNGSLLIGNGSGFSLASLTAGSGMTITSGSGAITLSATGVSADSLDFANFSDALTLDASTDIVSAGSDVFSLTNTGTGLSFRVNDTTGDTSPFVVDAAGRIGVGTTTPSRTLDIFQPDSEAQLRLSKSASVYGELSVDTVGDLALSTTGGDIKATNENLSVCAGGACPTFSPTAATGNLFVENGVVLGNNFELRNVSTTETGLYDHLGTAVIIFDEAAHGL